MVGALTVSARRGRGGYSRMPLRTLEFTEVQGQGLIEKGDVAVRRC
jgi:hypothetical protein